MTLLWMHYAKKSNLDLEFLLKTGCLVYGYIYFNWMKNDQDGGISMFHNTASLMKALFR